MKASRAPFGPVGRVPHMRRPLTCQRRAPSHGGASVHADGALVGTVTSAAWGHRVARNLAYAFIDPACAGIGTELTVDVMGIPQPARVIAPSPYDPDNRIVRSG